MELDSYFGIAGGFVLWSLVGLQPVAGQVVPDGSLSTTVDLSGSQINVRDGSISGANLFHSFQEFSIPTGSEVLFEHGTNIDRIVSRITGGNISTIDGLLRTTGTVDFILLNPNGINFGPNAQLQVGGDFLATSAESIEFADGTVFDAQDSTGSSLTVSIPVGLQLGQQPGEILVQGPGGQLSIDPLLGPIASPTVRNPAQQGLAVASGQTIGLLGGSINLEGGVLLAEGGRIELGAVADSLVGLDPETFALDYGGVSSFGPIGLTQVSLADVSGAPSGDIQVQGQQLVLSDGSTLLAQHLIPPAGGSVLGEINIVTSDSVIVQGSNPIDPTIRSSIASEVLTGPFGGDINVTTQQLTLADGGTIVARNFSATGGNGGNVDINAADSIEVSGVSLIPGVPTTLGTINFVAGDAGETSVDTGTLNLTGGGSILASTFGPGSGGELRVTATEISVSGAEMVGLQLPSILSVTTLGPGNAGDLIINTAQLNVLDGGRVDSSTVASGDAGNLIVTATDSILVDGTIPGSEETGLATSSFISASAIAVDPATQAMLGIEGPPTGGSGDLTITTPALIVSDGGLITANNVMGDGGDIVLTTESLVLLEDGTIQANAPMGQGGDVEIVVENLFALPGQITASSEIGLEGIVDVTTTSAAVIQKGIDLPKEGVIAAEQIVARACVSSSGEFASEFVVIGRGGLPAQPNAPLSQEALVPFDDAVPIASGAKQPPLPGGLEFASQQLAAAELPLPATGWHVNSQGQVILSPHVSTPTATVAAAPLRNCNE
ncbi:MAG: filamentous hemagglutinin N-terminal domain-containing protein [Cyanobacteria bacterium J06641_5]